MSWTAGAIGVGVIGCGYWGPNLVRNFALNEEFDLRLVCDARSAKAEAVGREHAVPAVTEVGAVLADPSIELVVVATPTASHFELARSAIMAGKHVLVTKPMTAHVGQAEELVALADSHGVLLAVDHTFLFTGAVRKMRELLVAGEIGDVYYIDSVRINLGLFQSDVNVIWDLAAHDVSIIDHLLDGELPRDVFAVGASHAGSPTEDVAYVTLRYRENLLAHVHVNWLAPAKLRRTIIGGSKKMMVFDDTSPSEKLRVYDQGVTIAKPSHPVPEIVAELSASHHTITYRTGDILAPKLDEREALATEVDHLARCLRHGAPPLADGRAGLRTVRILDSAQRSMVMAAHSDSDRMPAGLGDGDGQRQWLPQGRDRFAPSPGPQVDGVRWTGAQTTRGWHSIAVEPDEGHMDAPIFGRPAQQVPRPTAAGSATVAVPVERGACSNCAFPLSARALFCRRCGRPRG